VLQENDKDGDDKAAGLNHRKINLKYVESLRKLIQEDYELLSRPLEDVLKESFEKFKRGEDVGGLLPTGL